MVKLQFELAGNQKSKTLLVFLQGFPDNHTMWEWINWREDLAEHKIMFIDFPNTNGPVTHKWGVDFPEIVAGIKEAIDTVQGIDQRILVAHDWGCTYGYIFDKTYKGYFSQIITLDVPFIVELATFKQKIFVFAYQILMVILFLIGGRIGNSITKKWTKFCKHNPPYFEQIGSHNNYPYYYYWKNMLSSTFNKEKLFLKGYRPEVPIVYLYGTKKPFQFHGPKMMQWMEENKDKGCQIHAIEGGHWFMKKYPKFVTDLINRRVLFKR